MASLMRRTCARKTYGVRPKRAANQRSPIVATQAMTIIDDIDAT